MDRRVLVGMILLLVPLGAAADPPAAAGTASATPSKPAKSLPAASAQASPGPLVDGRPLAARRSRPLDLRLGDLRRYFTPAELQSPLPDMIGDEVVVEGGRDAPEAAASPVPVGLVAPFWAVSHPLSAWRIFVPDPNALPLPPPDPVPHYQP